MDEATVRQHAEGHAAAMVDGDFRRAARDLTDTGKADAPAVMEKLPKSIESAEVTAIDLSGDEATATILYRGQGREVAVESRWTEQEGAPMIAGLSLA
jgi:hypothetical protein